MPSPPDRFELFAWIGEDEHGSGEVGLKQYVVLTTTPPALMPMVSVHRHKLASEKFHRAMQAQADRFRKPIRLVRLVVVEELFTIQPRPQ